MERQKDSRSVKAVLSILVGLVLIIGQFASAGTVDSGPARTCACCSCAQLDCCATPAMPLPLTVPISSQSNEQRVQTPALIVVAVLISPPARSAAEIFPARHDLLLSKTGVPIYDRNCSYLI
jgi:hypothetical protein